MIKLHGTFRKINTAKIKILVGPDKNWKGKAKLFENQKGQIIASHLTEENFPGGPTYYSAESFTIIE